MAVIVHPDAFATTTVNGFTVYTTTESTALAVATNSLASIAIGTDINDAKLVGGIIVGTGWSNVAATLTAEASTDGTNWTATVASLIADTEPDVTGTKLGEWDLTSFKAPFYRLHFNASGLSVGTSGTLQFVYAFK